MVTSVAWSADGRWLASGGKGTAGGELFVWDARSMEPIGAMADDVGNVYVLAWQPGAATLVSGDGDGKLRWWDVLRGRCVRTQAAHRGTVQSLRSSPDGARLASCGDDGMIVLWDIRTGERLGSMRRDRPYERMDIAGLTGISELQRALLLTLGAADVPGAAGADQIMR
jgi:WD40 repeat protein